MEGRGSKKCRTIEFDSPGLEEEEGRGKFSSTSRKPGIIYG